MADENWKALRRCCAHVVIGTLLFVVVALAALGLHFVVIELTAMGVDRAILIGLKIAEYTVFGVDLFLYIFFILRIGIQLFRRLWALK